MAELIRLTVAKDPGEGDVICSLLRVEGIPSSMSPLPENLPQEGRGVSGKQEIFVRQTDLPKAQELLASKMD